MIVFTDLDGTLLNDAQQLSIKNKKTLQDLERKSIVRVVATGRSLYSANKVLDATFPIDYLIFSSGAAIMNWKTKEIIYKECIAKTDYQTIIPLLQKNEIHFMLHKQIPENHAFYFWGNPQTNPDFQARLQLYKEHAHPYTEKLVFDHDVTQFVAIFSPNELPKFQEISRKISHLKAIRTTSPLDHQSIWMEIFPIHVSKGHAAKWLCEYLQIKESTSMAIGNDYNDLDLLNWAKKSYVVANAPNELKMKFQLTASNNDDGFSKAVDKVFPTSAK